MKQVKAVFLDRDGVINREPGNSLYVTRWEDFVFLPGVFEALHEIKKKGYLVFIVSNQAGVSKGLFSQESLNDITARMLETFQERQIFIDGVYYCVHRDEDNCGCRKPKIGLLRQAFNEAASKGNAIDKARSYFVGDSMRDMEAGKAAGLKTVLIFSGKENPENANRWSAAPDMRAADLLEAVRLIQ